MLGVKEQLLKNKGQLLYGEEVSIPAGKVTLEGNLTIPQNAKSIVVFAHGSGSSRFSTRNRQVASFLNEHKLATLLADLLTPDEEEIDIKTRHLRFNIPMLADRLVAMAEWVEDNEHTEGLPLGYFGSSTGGGAALIAAAKKPRLVRAVVSRGGRPDLAGKFLKDVKAPALLIVGERDPIVVKMNKEALERLNDESRLTIIPQATHLFEERGALEHVAHLATEWFDKHLVK